MRILITGGTSGIGRAVAMERAARADEVHVVARDPAKLAALRRDLNGADAMAPELHLERNRGS